MSLLNGLFVQPGPMYLIDDDEVPIVSRGHSGKYRVRVWRGKHQNPVVLVTQKRGVGFPTTKLWNFVNQCMLHYPPGGFSYYEGWRHASGVPKLTGYTVNTIGHATLRPRAEWVIPMAMHWADLPIILGQRVSLD